MDPVAMQFLAQLDAVVDGEVPPAVMSGLMMCGEDAVPGLEVRINDPERSVESRVRAVVVLGRLGVPEAVQGLIDATMSGMPPLLHAAQEGLVGGGEAAVAALLSQAHDPSVLGQARCVLAGLALRAGAQPQRVAPLAIQLLAVAPREALMLMRMAPVAGYREALVANRAAVAAAPDLAIEILAALAPDVSPAELAMSRALADGLAEASLDLLAENTAGPEVGEA